MKKIILATVILIACIAVTFVVRDLSSRITRSEARASGTAIPFPASEVKTSSADKLIQQAELVIKVAPDTAEGYNLLCAAYIEKARQTGDFSFNARAESALHRAHELAPENFETMRLKAVLLLTNHKFGEALEVTRQAQRRHPNDAVIYGAMTDALLELGRYEEAEDAIETMLRLQANSAAYCRLSYWRALSGDRRGAIEAMQQAVRYANPRDLETLAWTRVHLGDELMNDGKIVEAESQYDLALQAMPDYYLAFSGKARARLRAGDIEGAIEYYRRSQDRVPLPDTAIALGDLFTLMGRPDEARKQYELLEFIERSGAPEAATYSRHLAMYYANHDTRLDEALIITRRERAARADIYTCDALAWCLFKSGQLQEARHAINDAMRLGTEDAQIFYHAGMIARAAGDRAAARQYLQRALSLNPQFDALQALQAREALESLPHR